MARSPSELLADAVTVYESVAAGEYVAAWEATLPIQTFAIESARGAGFKGAAPGADDEATQEEILAKLKDAKRELGKAPKRAKAKGAAGSLGDGKILKKVLEILLAFLPLIFKDATP
jgi:hypothetical protein